MNRCVGRIGIGALSLALAACASTQDAHRNDVSTSASGALQGDSSSESARPSASTAVPSGIYLAGICLAGNKLGAVGYDPGTDVITVCFADSYRCAALPKAGEAQHASGTVPLAPASSPSLSPDDDALADYPDRHELTFDAQTNIAVSQGARICASLVKNKQAVAWRCVEACR